MLAAKRGELPNVFKNQQNPQADYIGQDPFQSHHDIKPKKEKKSKKNDKKKKRVERPKFKKLFNENGLMMVPEEDELEDSSMIKEANKGRKLKKPGPQSRQDNYEVFTDAPQHMSYIDETMMFGQSRVRNQEHGAVNQGLEDDYKTFNNTARPTKEEQVGYQKKQHTKEQNESSKRERSNNFNATMPTNSSFSRAEKVSKGMTIVEKMKRNKQLQAKHGLTPGGTPQ